MPAWDEKKNNLFETNVQVKHIQLLSLQSGDHILLMYSQWYWEMINQ